MYRLLHLSDLHFGRDHYFRQSPNDPPRFTMGEAVADALARHGDTSPFDAVIISGDVLSNDQSDDVHKARAGLQNLMKSLRVESARVFCVPGNHDLTWRPDYAHNVFQFYEQLIGELHLPGRAPGADPFVAEIPSVSPSINRKSLALILLDSCRVESEAMAGYGRLGDDQLATLRHELKRRGITPTTHTIIAVLHHHLLPISPVEDIVDPERPKSGPSRTVSVTIDAVAVLRQLADLGVALVLHGHQHRPAILRYENLLASLPMLHVVAAGSCGTKPRDNDDVRRHFFVHEVDAMTVRSRSYAQADNPAHFQLGVVREFRLGLGSDDTRCLEDIRVADDVARVIEPGYTDNSDLCFIALSIVDCARSRAIIRELVATLPESSRWKELGRPSVKLVGMYDLLGRYDLLVRLRIAPRVNPEQIRLLIRDALEEQRMLTPQREQRGRDPFTECELYDVHQEWPTLEEMGTVRQGATEIKRVRLGTTEAYERARCQRAFILIPVDRESERDLAHDLRTAIAGDPASRRILESVSRGPGFLMFEVFMTCAQSTDINRLNRTIERVLSRYRAQKYTLHSYGYDETEISADAGA